MKLVLLFTLCVVGSVLGAVSPILNQLDKDSANLFPSNIRLNQVGFLPNDAGKRAFVYSYGSYNPKEGDEFYVINAKSKDVVYTGKLKDSGYDFKRGAFLIKAYANSITEWNPPYPLVSPDTTGVEHIFIAEFGSVKREGEYNVVCNGDTSWTFKIYKYLFNDLLNTELKFLALQRCGEDNWAHPACHTHDGEAVGHDGGLTGGWHDCGDHPKVSQTLGYTMVNLALISAAFEGKLSDQWNAEMTDSIFTDGIPDLLYEAYRGAKFALKCYTLSKEDGIFDKNTMYHSVGDLSYDHSWWGLPQWQDNVPESNGGRPRFVDAADAGVAICRYGATLALFSKVWQQYDKKFADSCLSAAKDMYDVVTENGTATSTSSSEEQGFYTGNNRQDDELAAIALGLLYATGDEKYKNYLFFDTKVGKGTSADYNAWSFRGGILGANSGGFLPGGWVTDWANIYSIVLYGIKKLILRDPLVAQQYGLTIDQYHELSVRTAFAYLKNLKEMKLVGSDLLSPGDPMAKPYNLPDFDFDWGFNRYNLGVSISGMFFVDAFRGQTYNVVDGLKLTHECDEKITIDFSNTDWMENNAIRHLDYILGLNPWDISFVVGTGYKNLNHPHNRTANPELLNNSAQRYPYQAPIGALMAGTNPSKGILKEDANNYVIDETCVDYSTTLLTMSATYAEYLPPDTTAPVISKLGWIQLDKTTEQISWENNELAKDTLYYSKDQKALQEFLKGNGSVDNKTIFMITPVKDPSALSDFQLKQLVTIKNLQENETYYFAIKTTDVKKNVRYYDNGGELYSFTMADIATVISDVHECNVTSNSAEILWNTDIQSNSMVIYGTKSGVYTDTIYYDDNSPSTYFHKVTLRDLSSQTKYYYKVKSGSTLSDENVFETTFEFAKLEITSCIEDNKLWIQVNNKENDKPYYGIEFRIYMEEMPTPSYVGSFVKQNWTPKSVYGPSSLSLTFDTNPHTDDNGHKYYSLKASDSDTLFPSGRWKFQVEFQGVTQDDMKKGWSLREHKNEGQFPDYDGIGYDASSPSDLISIRQPPDPWAGLPDFLENQYIVAYQKNTHIYGYYPEYDFSNGTLSQHYDVTVHITNPIDSKIATSTIVLGDTETYQLELKGTVTAKGEISGYGSIERIVINGTESADFDANNSGREVSFTYNGTLKEGVNPISVVAYGGGGGCYFGEQTIYVNYKRGKMTQSDLFVYDVSGNELSKTSNGEYIAEVNNTQLYFGVNDSDENVVPEINEKVKVILFSIGARDTESVWLDEVTRNSGFFSNNMVLGATIAVSTDPSALYDTKITTNEKDTIYVVYQDDDSKNDRTVKKIYVARDIPVLKYTDSKYIDKQFYAINYDTLYIKLKEKSAFEAGVEQLKVTVKATSGKDQEDLVLYKDKDNYYKSSLVIPINYQESGAKNNGVFEVIQPDSLYCIYVSKYSGESVVAKIPVIPGKIPASLTVYDNFGKPTTKAFIGEAKLYFEVDDKDENIKPAILESVNILIFNPSTNDSEYVQLTETGISSGVFSNFEDKSTWIQMLNSSVAKVGDGKLSCNDKDTIIVKYIDKDDPNDVVIKKIYVGSDFPMIYFTNSSYKPVASYIRNQDSVYVALRDSATWENAPVNDQIKIIIKTTKGDEDSLILYKQTKKHYYYSKVKIPIMFAQKDSLIQQYNGVIDAGAPDSLSVVYFSNVTGEMAYDIVPINAGNLFTLIKDFVYYQSANPSLLSYFKDKKYSISFGLTDKTTKWKLFEIEQLGLKNISAIIYDGYGGVVKRFDNFEIEHKGDLYTLRFHHKWDGRNKYGNYVSTGVYFVRFHFDYKGISGEPHTQDIVKNIYIINNIK